MPDDYLLIGIIVCVIVLMSLLNLLIISHEANIKIINMRNTVTSNALTSSVSVRSPIKKDSFAPDSPMTKFFLTSSNTLFEKELYGEGYGIVLELHKELSVMIDNIGSKVTEAIDRSESEFLIAYRNHMKKIRN